ncbi:hypothetical protein ABPG73_004685 [Tetrahymena malaccensis]
MNKMKQQLDSQNTINPFKKDYQIQSNQKIQNFAISSNGIQQKQENMSLQFQKDDTIMGDREDISQIKQEINSNNKLNQSSFNITKSQISQQSNQAKNNFKETKSFYNTKQKYNFQSKIDSKKIGQKTEYQSEKNKQQQQPLQQNIRDQRQKILTIQDQSLSNKIQKLIFRLSLCKKKKIKKITGLNDDQLSLIDYQINKNLDIQTLLQDLITLKKAIMILLSQDQLAALQLIGCSQKILDLDFKELNMKQKQIDKNLSHYELQFINSQSQLLQQEQIQSFLQRCSNNSQELSDIDFRILSSLNQKQQKLQQYFKQQKLEEDEEQQEDNIDFKEEDESNQQSQIPQFIQKSKIELDKQKSNLKLINDSSTEQNQDPSYLNKNGKFTLKYQEQKSELQYEQNNSLTSASKQKQNLNLSLGSVSQSQIFNFSQYKKKQKDISPNQSQVYSPFKKISSYQDKMPFQTQQKLKSSVLNALKKKQLTIENKKLQNLIQNLIFRVNICKKKNIQLLNLKNQLEEIDSQIQKEMNIQNIFKDILFLKKAVMLILNSDQLAALQFICLSKNYLDYKLKCKYGKESNQISLEKNLSHFEKQFAISQSELLQFDQLEHFLNRCSKSNNLKELDQKIISSLKIDNLC